MASVTLDELKDILGVTDSQLNKLCPNHHLRRLASSIEDWRQYAEYLKLERWQIRHIETNDDFDYLERTFEMLKTWKKTVLEKGTYLTLATTFLAAGNAKLAGEVCKLSKDSKSRQTAVAPKPSLSPSNEIASNEIAIVIDLEPKQLDREITNDPSLLLPLAEVITDWVEVATALGISDAEKLTLQTNVQLSPKMKTVEMLKRWHSVTGYGASYRVLVEAYLMLGQAGLAKKVCLVVKDYLSTRADPGFPGGAKPSALARSPDAITADDIARNIGLKPTKLDRSFSDDYRLTLAVTKLIPDWYEFATSLGVSPVEKEWIQSNNQLNYMMKAMEVIKSWKRSEGYKATYRVLIDACLRLNNIDLATQMCRLLM